MGVTFRVVSFIYVNKQFIIVRIKFCQYVFLNVHVGIKMAV